MKLVKKLEKECKSKNKLGKENLGKKNVCRKKLGKSKFGKKNGVQKILVKKTQTGNEVILKILYFDSQRLKLHADFTFLP